MNIQFNMTNAQGLGQEELKRNIANSDDSTDDCRRIEKQPPRSQPSQSLEILISAPKKIAKGKNKAIKNGKNHIKDSLNHETHILAERGRRKKMKDMFSKLHALLPQLPPQADQSTIVDEARSSIKSLEQNLPFPCNDPVATFDTWSSRNLVLNICGNEAFFTLCCPKEKSGVFTTVCYLFEKYNIEVLFANVSTNVFRRTYMIQAQVNPSSNNQLNENGIGVGEIFKQAAQELVLYFPSS